MTTPDKKTVATGAAGVAIAVITALLAYCENREEIKAKYDASQVRAAHGYAALADSVKELQSAAKSQHEYLVKLEERVEGLKDYIRLAVHGQPAVVGGGSTRVRPLSVTRDAGVADASDDLPSPAPPHFEPLPASYSAAQMKQ